VGVVAILSERHRPKVIARMDGLRATQQRRRIREDNR